MGYLASCLAHSRCSTHDSFPMAFFTSMFSVAHALSVMLLFEKQNSLIIIRWGCISFDNRCHYHFFLFYFHYYRDMSWYLLQFCVFGWTYFYLEDRVKNFILPAVCSKSINVLFYLWSPSILPLNPFISHHISLIFPLCCLLNHLALSKYPHALLSCPLICPPIPIVLKTLLLDHLFFRRNVAAEQGCLPTRKSWKHLL